MTLNPHAYEALVVKGEGHHEGYQRLKALEPAQLLLQGARDEMMAKGIMAGLWLWFDWLDESHRLSQTIPTEIGAYWHGIMHRREGDFDNALYWLGRCEGHPVLQAIGNNASTQLNDMPADNRLIHLMDNTWNAKYLVELVKTYAGKPDDPFTRVVIAMQQLEWRILMEYCAAMA